MCLGKTGLLAIALFSCVTGVQLSRAAETTGVLSGDGATLTVEVDEGEVAEFDPSVLLGSLATVQNVIKTGKGRLDLGDEDDLDAYLGTITIRQGTYRVAASNNLGCVTSTSAGPVRVENGGALEFMTAVKAKFRLGVKTFYLAGTGPYGDGAVIYNCTAEQGGASLGWHVYLTEDARVSITNTALIYWNNQVSIGGGAVEGMYVHLNGHELHVTCANGASGKNLIFGHLCLDESQGGSILVNGLVSQVFNSAHGHIRSYDGGHFAVTNSGVLQLTEMYGDMLWGIDAYKGGRLQSAAKWSHALGNGTIDFVSITNYNRWQGPVRLYQDWTRVDIIKSNKDVGTIGFAGPVSGNGGLSVLKSSPTAAYTPYFHLYCPTNTFTGGLSANLMNVYLWQNGALPADGGALLSTNGTVMLMDTVGAYSLPSAVFSGTGALHNARGAWKGPVKKTGEGLFVYDSMVDGGRLEVESGTFRIVPRTVRAKFAGLVEGDGFYPGTTQEAQAAAGTSSATAPTPLAHRLATGAAALYDKTYRDFWTYDEMGTARKRRVFTYSGWIWNDSDSAETWTFAGAAGTTLSVWVNGSLLFHSGWDGKQLWGIKAVTMNPGANSIVVTVYNSGTGAGPRSAASLSNAVWNKANFGLGYCRGDCTDSVDVANFSPLVDPGDGSLLTYRLETDVDFLVPGMDFVQSAVPCAQFTNIFMRSGATLDLAGGSYSTRSISGVPTVCNCPSFTVTDSWSVSAADAAAGRTAQFDGALAFAAGAKLVLEDPLATLPPGDYALATATGGVTGSPRLPDGEAYRYWRVQASAAGVTLQKLSRGTVLLLK